MAKFCKYCGTAIDENTDICLNCGTKIIKTEENTKICKYCKTKIDKKAKICPNCRKTQNFSIFRVIAGVVIGLFIIIYIESYYFSSIPARMNYTYTSSSSDDYISLSEFNEIENGMSYEEVKEIVGSEGTIMSETNIGNTNTIIYYWYGKDGVSNANFTFSNNKLINKTQIALK